MPGLERKRAFRGRGDEHRGAGMGRAGRRPINTWARTRFLRHLGQGAHRRVCPAFTVALCSQQPLPPSPRWAVLPGHKCPLWMGSAGGRQHLRGQSPPPRIQKQPWSLLPPGSCEHPGSLVTWGGGAWLYPHRRGGPVHGGKSQEKQPDLENQSPPGDPSFRGLCWGMVPSP